MGEYTPERNILYDPKPEIAVYLGISFVDFKNLDPVLEENYDEYGGISSYTIEFSKGYIFDSYIGLKTNHENKVTISVNDLKMNSLIYQDALVDSIVNSTKPLESFYQAIEDINTLNNLRISKTTTAELLLRQNYISLISTLETYLAETIVNKVSNSDKCLVNFVESYPELEKMKFKMSEIFKKQTEIQMYAINELVKIIYHNLDKVSNLYESTLRIKFPRIDILMKHVSNRHHLVHRNGRTKNSDIIKLNKLDLESLREEVVYCVEFIEAEIKKNAYY